MKLKRKWWSICKTCNYYINSNLLQYDTVKCDHLWSFYKVDPFKAVGLNSHSRLLQYIRITIINCCGGDTRLLKGSHLMRVISNIHVVQYTIDWWANCNKKSRVSLTLTNECEINGNIINTSAKHAY